MSLQHTAPMTHAQLSEANERLNERLREENLRKWEAVWKASGIKFAGLSMEGWDGTVREPGQLPDILPVGDADIAPGDIVALRDDDIPTDANQRLHLVIATSPAEPGKGVLALPGPALPRSEWPEAMREATVPTLIHVEAAMDMDGSYVTVKSEDGRAIFQHRCHPDALGIREGYLASSVAKAARLGFADGSEGRRRGFEIAKGHGGAGRGGRTWQVADDLGNASDVEGRGVLQRSPPEFVRAVLAATRAAYADGMAEALDVKAARDLDAEEAPRIGM